MGPREPKQRVMESIPYTFLDQTYSLYGRRAAKPTKLILDALFGGSYSETANIIQGSLKKFEVILFMQRHDDVLPQILNLRKIHSKNINNSIKHATRGSAP